MFIFNNIFIYLFHIKSIIHRPLPLFFLHRVSVHRTYAVALHSLKTQYLPDTVRSPVLHSLQALQSDASMVWSASRKCHVW